MSVKWSIALLLWVVPVLAWSEPAADALSHTARVDSAVTTASLAKVAVGLGFVVLAIFASAWLFRRFGRGGFLPHSALRIIGGLSMGQRERVVLLQVGKEQILIGISPGRIQTLHVLQEPIETETAGQERQFSSKLNEALKQWQKS